MLNLVLYSDQIIPANEKIDWALVALMDGRGRRIGYIPSGPDPGAVFYSQKQAYYARYGLTLETFFDLDCDHSGAELAALFHVTLYISRTATPRSSSLGSGAAKCWKSCATGRVEAGS